MSRDNRQFGKLAKAYVEKIVLFTGRAVDLNLLMVATWKLTDKATNDKDREISSAIVRQLSTFSGPALIISSKSPQSTFTKWDKVQFLTCF